MNAKKTAIGADLEQVEEEGHVFQDGQVETDDGGAAGGSTGADAAGQARRRRAPAAAAAAAADATAEHFQTHLRHLGRHLVPVKVGQAEEALHRQLKVELDARRVLARLGRAGGAQTAGARRALGLHVDGQLFVEQPADFFDHFLDRVARLLARLAHAVEQNVTLVAVVHQSVVLFQSTSANVIFPFRGYILSFT